MIRFKVCGPLSAEDGHTDRTPTPPKLRRVLALLLLRANQSVSTDAIIDELWGDDPPNRALASVQTYIYQLRRLFDGTAATADGSNWLVTATPGYQATIDPDQIDFHVFQRLTRAGRAMLDAGEPEQAAQSLRAALDLWSGGCLDNVVAGRLLRPHMVRLEEERLRALELRIIAELRLGRHSEVVPELRTLVAVYPLNEWLHARLIEALSLSGRRSEALQAYQELRELLHEQLGIDPQPEIQQLHRQVLGSGDPHPPTHRTGQLRPALLTA